MRFAPSSVALFVIGLTLRTTATLADSHGNRGKDAHAHRHLERSALGGIAEGSSSSSGTTSTVVAVAGSSYSETPTAVAASTWAFQRRANTTTSAFAAASSNSTATSTSSVTLPLPPSTAPLSPPSPVPTPLDLSISYALSTSCVNYLTTLLSSSAFISCLPFSLLLTTSTGYSSIVSSALSSGNYSTLNSLIAYTASPQPNGTTCDTYMTTVQKSLGAKGNCASDINSDPPVQVALQAQNGIGNYQLMRTAEQLTDPDSGVYCYLKALENEKPDDLYLYQIPAGIALPSTSTPSCSKCSALLLNTYTSSTSSQTLNSTLVNSAITRVNNACGPTFVSLAAQSTSTSSTSGASSLGLPFSSAVGKGVIVISMMMMTTMMMV